jgi:hypothetical protein
MPRWKRSGPVSVRSEEGFLIPGDPELGRPIGGLTSQELGCLGKHTSRDAHELPRQPEFDADLTISPYESDV